MVKLTISRLTVVFGIVVTIGLSLSVGMQWLTLKELKVGGRFSARSWTARTWSRTSCHRLFLVEAYGMASEATLHEELLADNLRQIREQRKAYDERRSYWGSSALPDNLKGFWKARCYALLMRSGSTSKETSRRQATEATAPPCGLRSIASRSVSGTIRSQCANLSR